MGQYYLSTTGGNTRPNPGLSSVYVFSYFYLASFGSTIYFFFIFFHRLVQKGQTNRNLSNLNIPYSDRYNQGKTSRIPKLDLFAKLPGSE